jgi:hypothetical protein
VNATKWSSIARHSWRYMLFHITSYRWLAVIDMNDCLLSICMIVFNPYTCLSEHRTLHMKSYNWILRARVGKKCLWHDVLSWIWINVWHGPPICLMYDMVLSSILRLIWSHHLSYAGHGHIICLISDMVDCSVICLIHLHTIPINDICNACYQSMIYYQSLM